MSPAVVLMSATCSCVPPLFGFAARVAVDVVVEVIAPLVAVVDVVAVTCVDVVSLTAVLDVVSVAAGADSVCVTWVVSVFVHATNTSINAVKKKRLKTVS